MSEHPRQRCLLMTLLKRVMEPPFVQTVSSVYVVMQCPSSSVYVEACFFSTSEACLSLSDVVLMRSLSSCGRALRSLIGRSLRSSLVGLYNTDLGLVLNETPRNSSSVGTGCPVGTTTIPYSSLHLIRSLL